jgi:hypothetical protein
MSGYATLTFTEIADYESKAENIAVTVRAGENGALAVIYERILDIQVDLAFETEKVSYADMYNALAERAYLYGYVAEGARLEMLAEDGTWTEVNLSASKPAEGESDTTEPTEATDPAVHETETEDARPEPDKEEQNLEAETMLESGTYRLRYEIKNGDSLIEGFVYTEYGA